MEYSLIHMVNGKQIPVPPDKVRRKIEVTVEQKHVNKVGYLVHCYNSANKKTYWLKCKYSLNILSLEVAAYR
jgi:hypothetical protein